ncbi:chitinase family protein [Pseudomonas aeruginosa]|uniref:Chitinase class I family protein n=1 Tax=Pseudomonas paraeruginosa TaxID=2994495 RepID=A0A2R3IRL0_9PSED|nr:chitinase class I family protein [Pseudomonas paraeruginosa]QDL02849.1 hypothetical protein IHMA87_02571 [Pseudomonas aeruginosa]AWE91624.1 chitinase class I family protein [Pseudomonas paraeruginosa]VCY56495.1 hypothetical protein BANRA_02365 [Pseudomonas aeruginosa]VFT60897.1 chitinase family protein [Pseudomonas aeruginosa]
MSGFRHGVAEATEQAVDLVQQVPAAAGQARNPQAITDNAYAARNGNGDEVSGDGWRFRGRGLLQITGRANYRAAGAGLDQPLEQEPELLERPEFAALSAAWWWSKHGLNELADRGEFAAITRRINGGFNGQAERVELWERAKRVLS